MLAHRPHFEESRFFQASPHDSHCLKLWRNNTIGTHSTQRVIFFTRSISDSPSTGHIQQNLRSRLRACCIWRRVRPMTCSEKHGHNRSQKRRHRNPCVELQMIWQSDEGVVEWWTINYLVLYLRSWLPIVNTPEIVPRKPEVSKISAFGAPRFARCSTGAGYSSVRGRQEVVAERQYCKVLADRWQHIEGRLEISLLFVTNICLQFKNI